MPDRSVSTPILTLSLAISACAVAPHKTTAAIIDAPYVRMVSSQSFRYVVIKRLDQTGKLNFGLVPRTRSSHILCGESQCELRVQTGTRIIELLVSFRIRSSRRADCKANVEIRTLDAFSFRPRQRIWCRPDGARSGCAGGRVPFGPGLGRPSGQSDGWPHPGPGRWANGATGDDRGAPDASARRPRSPKCGRNRTRERRHVDSTGRRKPHRAGPAGLRPPWPGAGACLFGAQRDMAVD